MELSHDQQAPADAPPSSLSTISEEPPKTTTPTATPTTEPREAAPDNKPPPAAPVKPASVSGGHLLESSSPAVRSQATHSIDPLTLSLVPFPQQQGAIGTKKSVLPVVGDNQASAMPTSGGSTTPTSAKELAMVPSSSDPDDLMTFSVSPAILQGVMGHSRKQEGTRGGVALPGGHQLESRPPELTSADEDLIKFSIAASHLHTAAATPNTTSRRGGGTRPSQGTATTADVPSGLMRGVSPSRPTPSPPPPSSSSSVPRPHPSQVPRPLVSSQPAALTNQLPGKLRPNWEHFSNDPNRPSGGAPQKLIQSVGVASQSSPSVQQKVGVASQKSPQKVGVADTPLMDQTWTVVSKVEEGGVVSPALQQLKRVASQPGFSESASSSGGVAAGAVGVVGDKGGVVRMPVEGAEFLIQQVALRDEGEGQGVGPGVKGGVDADRRFRPLPPTPDEFADPTDLLLRDLQVSPLPSDPHAKPPDVGGASLLEDLEYAFPHADHMFSATGVKGQAAGVKGRDNTGGKGAKDLDYVELALGPPTGTGRMGVANRGAKTKKNDDSRVDYTEIKVDSRNPGVGVAAGVASQGGEDGDYSKLADVLVQRSRDRPIGGDPLYSTPDKVRQKSEVGPDEVRRKSAGVGAAGGGGGRGSSVGVAGAKVQGNVIAGMYVSL